MTGNILLGKFSPKHFMVSPEQQERWLDWDRQLSRAISLEVTPHLAVKADDTQTFSLSRNYSSPISYDEYSKQGHGESNIQPSDFSTLDFLIRVRNKRPKDTQELLKISCSLYKFSGHSMKIILLS